MNERIQLIDVARTLDTGQTAKTETTRTVWAGLRSVTRSEFYAAYQAGMSPELVFKVNSRELGAAEYLEYGGQRYKILRSYKVDEQYTELTCERMR